jgi:hypothetical protein
MALCAFVPDGRHCPNPAAVTVNLARRGWPPHKVLTCDQHVNDWLDEVAATARPLDPEPAVDNAGD